VASEKAERIVDHFTADPNLKAEILGLIDEIKANPGKHNFDTVIARFTSDPQLAAEIKANFEHMRQGGTPHGIASKYSSGRAGNAAATAQQHWEAVEGILKS
jgi:hypothetical protein